MSDDASPDDNSPSLPSKSAPYVVVARRYRPQGFFDLVGQDQVVEGLKRAIATDRVGHAYLFTGARGVGKTSLARIFAKSLNCVDGPTATPCGKCDICEAVSAGEDIDVIEIDGASNRQIDDIREIRSNISIRPSRAKFKIYIIDEVHMLTREAFNALLKTLEEPPGHVKFIFCTTDPEKIPITVLSRCQRFDFSPIASSEIVDRLAFIVQSEEAEVDPAALKILARRAGGSMRDSQSLLEQLLAFKGKHITVEAVHSLLGTASRGRLTTLIERAAASDAAGALAELEAATAEGVDAGQLAEQLLGVFRDLMAASVDGSIEIMLHSEPEEYEAICALSQSWGLEKILAAIQILDHAIMRMRQSLHARTLLEAAVVRLCRLESLDDISTILAHLKSGGSLPAPASPPPAPGRSPSSHAPPVSPRPEEGAKKKRPGESSPAPRSASLENAGGGAPKERAPLLPLSAETIESVWKEAREQLSGIPRDYARCCDSVHLEMPNRLILSLSNPLHKSQLEKPEPSSQIKEAILAMTGKEVQIQFQQIQRTAAASQPSQKPLSRQQRFREAAQEPIVKQAMELFDAELTDVADPPSPKG